PLVAMASVPAAFFDAMGMPIVRGRKLPPADFSGDVLSTVVNDTLVRLAFPGQNPIGQRIALYPHRLGPNPVWFTIVGVVKTTPTITLDEPRPVAKMYVPMDATHDFWQPTEMMTYVLRTSVPPA